ncbi:MAG: bifunctional DNA primase/polymerase, partial [Halapricum sp.]
MAADSPSGEQPDTLDVTDVTDADRARMLREYLGAFVAEFDTQPKLMPLDAEGKAPIIKGRCRLDSLEARDLLVTGEEAVRRLRENGARGFALYAGKPAHGTADAVFVDHDDLTAFPAPTADPTLTVRTGSGRGVHETYRNAGDVQNARVGDDHGEIRAQNWYVVVPGSIHPSGGVYHVEENLGVATLADADLDDHMRPATRANGGVATATGGPSTTGATAEPMGAPAPDYDLADDPPAADYTFETYVVSA